MLSTPTVAVIIPTTCDARRGPLLLRAIDSVLAQEGVTIELFVVVNGQDYDAALFRQLQADSRLTLLYSEPPNCSIARYAGLRRVTADFFCFLDDDDELLTHSCRTRADLFAGDGAERPDIVVTNGVERYGGHDHVLLPPEAAASIAADPGISFLTKNWFASCGPMFNRASIDPGLFNLSLRYFEWTYLFFLLLSRGKRFRYHDVVTYRINKENVSSVSRTSQYEHATADVLSMMLRLPLDRRVRRLLRSKYVVALNTRAALELREGQRRRAWSTHARCVFNGGWRYLPFTRHLLFTATSTDAGRSGAAHGARIE